MTEVTEALSTIFRRIAAAALEWSAVHLLSKTGNDETIALDRSDVRAQKILEKPGAAYRTRTCDPRITNAMLYQLS